MRHTCRHPAFYANLETPDLVKSPVVFVAGGLRTLNKTITQNSWSWILEGMGQVPFYPPNVSGWAQGPDFLNTNTVRAYWTAADYLLQNAVNDPGDQTPAAAVSSAVNALVGPWCSTGTRAQLETYAAEFVTRNGPLGSHGRIERQKVIKGLLMAGPDGLLH